MYEGSPLLPHDIEAEEAVVGSIVLDGDSLNALRLPNWPLLAP